MKNPFKKSSIIDTVTNVAIGGAANVAMDYALNSIGDVAGFNLTSGTTKHAVKIAVGALAGSMVKSKYAHAAFDGIATVGAANLIDGLVNGDNTNGGGDNSGSENGAGGLPYGMIGSRGKIRMGQRGFRRSVAGTPSALMDK